MVLDKINAKRLLTNNKRESFYVLKFNTESGISESGEMMDKSTLLKCIDEASFIQLKESIINMLEIFNTSNVILQVFIGEN